MKINFFISVLKSIQEDNLYFYWQIKVLHIGAYPDYASGLILTLIYHIQYVEYDIINSNALRSLCYLKIAYFIEKIS